MRIPLPLFFCTVFYLGLSHSSLAQDQQANLAQELAQVGVAQFTASSYKPGRVKHIVLFRYASNVSTEQKKAVVKAFMAMKETRRGNIPYIEAIEAGEQNSGEKMNCGYTQGFIVTFRSEGDRNYYVGSPIVNDPVYTDPAHTAFKRFVAPMLAKDGGVLVFDFTVNFDE